jgi:invasion protein IalB
MAAANWRVVLLGLTVAVIAHRADAQQSTTATYEDWTVRCSTGAGSPPQKSCDMEQLSYGQSKEQPFSRLAILRRDNGKQVSLVVQVPVSVWLATGVRIEIGGKDADLSAPFARCGPAGCFAEFGLTDDAQKRFRTVTEPGRILYKNAAQQDMAIPLSFKGFGQAFDALAKN